MSTASPAAIEPAIEATSGIAGDRRMLSSVVIYCLLAAVAFTAACAGWGLVIDRLHARPEIPEPFHSKIEAMFQSTRAAEIDTIFIGSSRFFHGIDPAAFDRETARLGAPTHSYNLGFDALNFPELHFVMQWLLTDRRMHFKTLFIEPSLRVRLAPGLENSQRAVVLHNMQNSEYIANFILRGNLDWQRKLFWLYEQGQVTLTRLSNTGALTNAYIRPQEPPPPISTLVGANKDGYIGIPPQSPLPITEELLTQIRADQAAEEKAGTARSLNDFEISQLMDEQKLAAAHGVRLLLITHPTATPETLSEFSAISRASREGRLDLPLSSFADPITYFDLNQASTFVDIDHINTQATIKLSTIAADAFVSRLKAGKAGGVDAVH